MRLTKNQDSQKGRASRHLWFAMQRFVASARAGSFLGRFRKSARFAARGIDQDDVLLLMPREPSLTFYWAYWAPLAIAFAAGGAMLGFVT
jgi:hypothetical protein